jgi:hypothetical protein
MGEQHSISAYQKEVKAARFSFFHFSIKALLGIIGRMSVPNALDKRLRIILFQNSPEGARKCQGSRDLRG